MDEILIFSEQFNDTNPMILRTWKPTRPPNFRPQTISSSVDTGVSSTLSTETIGGKLFLNVLSNNVE